MSHSLGPLVLVVCSTVLPARASRIFVQEITLVLGREVIMIVPVRIINLLKPDRRHREHSKYQKVLAL
jgi:hypothetical protein